MYQCMFRHALAAQSIAQNLRRSLDAGMGVQALVRDKPDREKMKSTHHALSRSAWTTRYLSEWLQIAGASVNQRPTVSEICRNTPCSKNRKNEQVNTRKVLQVNRISTFRRLRRSAKHALREDAGLVPTQDKTRTGDAGQGI